MRPTSARAPLQLGMEVLLADHREWIEGLRIGLVSHAAAVNRDGLSSAEVLRRDTGLRLAALFGPEHGFGARAGAGETVPNATRDDGRLPVFSLYGDTRRPTAAMLSGVDVLVIELQDLGARPYTYVSTLRLVMEAAAECGKPVIVADRPIPLPLRPDGPLITPGFESFVAPIPAPMQYGLTQAETARWLAAALQLPLDLRVAPMRHYRRDLLPQPSWPPWFPPSPRIRSWESAALFTCTVFGEALPALDYGSGTDLSFQVIGAPWLDAARLRDALDVESIPGLAFEPLRYVARSGQYAGVPLDGLRLVVTDYHAFRPIAACVRLLDRIQGLYGRDALWSAPGTRLEWFDRLFGTDRVRRALLSGQPGQAVAASWTGECRAFARTRAPHLLYPGADLP